MDFDPNLSHQMLVAFKKKLINALLESNQSVLEQIKLESDYLELEGVNQAIYLRSKCLSEVQAEILASGLIRCVKYNINLPSIAITKV